MCFEAGENDETEIISFFFSSEDVPLVEFMYLVFTHMPGVNVLV